MESARNKLGTTWWLTAIALAVIAYYAVTSFWTTPSGSMRVMPVAGRSIDISNGSFSTAFQGSSRIATKTTVKFAASPQNAALGKDAYCPARGCSFVLSSVSVANVQDRTIKIVGDYPGSTSELTYTCYDCPPGCASSSTVCPGLCGPAAFPGRESS